MRLRRLLEIEGAADFDLDFSRLHEGEQFARRDFEIAAAGDLTIP